MVGQYYLTLNQRIVHNAQAHFLNVIIFNLISLVLLTAKSKEHASDQKVVFLSKLYSGKSFIISNAL